MACAWLRQQACDAVACEVRLPLSNFRVDVAGYRAMKGMSAEPGATFAVECKQSRADFLRDAGKESMIIDKRDGSFRRMERLRGLLSTHLPQCRLQQSLFAEYDTYDFSSWRHATWFKLNAEYLRLARKASLGVKFDKIARFGSARFCYLVVSQNVVRSESELPLGWGCLEARRGNLALLNNALPLATSVSARLKLLERIARAISRPKLEENEMSGNRAQSNDAAVISEVNQFSLSDDSDHPLAGENAGNKCGEESSQ